MPQLDVFTYFSISVYFFFTFSVFYTLVAYCIFPVFNFVQKSRFFFTVVIDDFLCKNDIFNNAVLLKNIKFFTEISKVHNFKFKYNILNFFYQSSSYLFFIELEFLYLNFAKQQPNFFFNTKLNLQ